MVVHDPNAGLGIRVEDGGVELDECAVFPKRGIAGAVETHAIGDHGQTVVAPRITQIARADLGAHIPAVERRSGKIHAADPQNHVREDRNRIPLQAEF